MTYIKEVLSTITNIGYSYLAGTSAIVAALLALITIVFSQYNERLVHKSSEILKELNQLFSSDQLLNKYQNISDKINELIFLQKNQKGYKLTIKFFIFISWCSAFTWLITSIGYIYSVFKANKGDTIILILASLIIISIFFFLPIILLKFNKITTLKITRKGNLKFEKLINYVTKAAPTYDENIISNLLDPKLILKLNHSSSLFVDFNQKIPITNCTYLYEFISADNLRQYIKIHSSHSINNANVYSKNKYEDKFEGYYQSIKLCTTANLYIYSDKTNQILSTHFLKVIRHHTSLSIVIDENTKINMNEWAFKIIDSKKAIHYISSDSHLEYDLKNN